MNASTIRIYAVGIALLGIIGCASAGEVDRLEARVKSLEAHRETTEAEMAGKLERLNKMLSEAEETLRKSGADLGIRMQRLEQDFPKVKGGFESFQFRIAQVTNDLAVIKKELADRLGWTVVYLPNDLPKDPDGIWKAAQDRAKADKFQEAKAIYELFEASFPDDPRAVEALVETGKLLERAGDVEGAIKAYQGVYERHEQSPQAPAATFRIAELFVAQKLCDRARAIFKFVSTNFRGTTEAEVARERMRTVRDECKE